MSQLPAPPPGGQFVPDQAGAPLPPDAEFDDADDGLMEDEFDEFDEAPAPARPLMTRLRRLSPAAVLLSAASVVSLLFLALNLTILSVQLPVLAASCVFTGIMFAADAVILARGTWRATIVGETGRALLLTLAFGVLTVIAGLSFAGAVVMVLLQGF
jgi:hypothetical protein